MSILGQTTTRQFLQRYWQKEPLLIRQSATDVEGPTTDVELFELGCHEDVESRLVIFDSHSRDWRAELGPFEPSDLTSLGERDWTLLVQAVDQWVPEVASLLERFRFLPRWRLDDVMVSYASIGGGVGPHFDYYDVFLVQVAGLRRWRVGERCDERTPLRDHPSMKLLERFNTVAEHELAPGDVLYLPPGVSHWGTATSDGCVTYSVGLRAPAHREVLQHAAELLAERLPQDQRYADSPDSIDTDLYRIDNDLANRLSTIWTGHSSSHIARALAQAFGCQVTEPRYPELIDAGDEPAPALPQDIRIDLSHHPSSRFAYQLTEDGADLFVDGERHPTTLTLARAVCHGCIDAEVTLLAAERELLTTLLEQGSVRIR